jgi:hypothetical protein
MLYENILNTLSERRNSIVSAINKKGGVLNTEASLKDCENAILNLSGGSSANIYKCATVSEDKTTWSGYLCTYNEEEKRFYVAETPTENLTCSGPITPVVGYYYDEQCRYQCYTLKQGDGLLAYYPLTADAKDYSGNGYDGTAAGSVEFDPNYGATLNGKHDAYILFYPFRDMTGANTLGDFTFSFWYHMLCRAQQRILIDTNKYWEEFDVQFWDGKFTIRLWQKLKIDNTEWESGWTEWQPDQIPVNNIIITRLNDTCSVYRNGVFVTSINAAGLAFDFDIRMGEFDFDSGDSFWGNLSDVRFYSKGKTAEEALKIYNDGRFNGI